MANDANASGTAVTIPTVVFYPTKADAENDTNGFTAATNFANANFVRVVVAARRARYALTPIVGAFTSGDISAEAVAGLGSAICKVPPVMICNPAEPDTNTNVDLAFDGNALAGHGLRLISVGNGNTAWAPGNFGYLDTGSSTSNPNVELRQALGWLTAPGDCSGLSGVKTRTGAGTPVTQALNTRFDIYDKPNTGNGNSGLLPDWESCPPSINTVKDVLRKGNAGNGSKCGFANNEWELPTQTVPSNICRQTSISPTRPTYPMRWAIRVTNATPSRINGSCTYNSITPAKIGDGTWDRNAYFQVNYGWSSTAWPNNINSGVQPDLDQHSEPLSSLSLGNCQSRNDDRREDHPRRSPGRRYSSPARRSPIGQPVCSPLQSPASNGVVPGGHERRPAADFGSCSQLPCI